MRKVFSKILSGKPVSTETKTVVHNFFFLAVVQATNFIIPLIILPYLVTVVGIEKFGEISFAQSLMSYFIIITDYGFNLTATREIVSHREDVKKLSSIVSNTLVIKFLLSVASFLVLLILILSFPKLSDNATLFYLSFSLVIGQLLMPTWFFQGMEKMHFLAYINVVGKVLFTALIFFLVTVPADYIYVPVYLSLGNILSGMLGIWIMFRRFRLRFELPTTGDLKEELSKGSSIMFSNFAINAYVNSNIVILGFFTNSLVTGYYSVAEKILYCVRQIMTLFFQATYPRICKLAKQSHNELVNFYKKFFLPFTAFIFAISIAVFFLAGIISSFVVKDNPGDLVMAIRLFAFLPVVICINIPAYQTLLANNHQNSAMLILISGSIFNLALNLFLAASFGLNGTIWAVILTEIYITAGLHLVLRYRHPQIKLSLQKFSTNG